MDVSAGHLLDALGGDDLVDVEEAVLLQADVDERRLHAGQDVGDLADVHVAHHAALGALYVELDELAVLQQGHASLVDVMRDEHLA